MVISIARETVLTALLLSAPPLLMGLVVGLIISIFQAVTQIQEQTLTFVPKLIAVLVSLVVFGPWMLNLIMGFMERILGNLGSIIH